MREPKERFGVIGRGRVGWHAEVVPRDTGGCITSGSSQGGQFDEYVKHAIEGALVYDAASADYSAFAKMVIHGPMLNLRLAPDEYEPFGKAARALLLDVAPSMDGSFQAVAKLAERPDFKGFDYVGVGIYEALLREVPGIRIGHVNNGAVVWES